MCHQFKCLNILNSSRHSFLILLLSVLTNDTCLQTDFGSLECFSGHIVNLPHSVRTSIRGMFFFQRDVDVIKGSQNVFFSVLIVRVACFGYSINGLISFLFDIKVPSLRVVIPFVLEH